MADTLPPDPVQYEDIYVEVPQWPKVVGILSIIWGSLGVCCNGLGAGFYAFMPKLMKMAEEQNGPTPPEMLPPPLFTASMGIGACITGLLLVAGILCVRRTIAARPAHLLYAVLSIGNTALGTVVGMQYQNGVQDFMQKNPDSPYARNAGMGGGGGANMALMVLMTGIALGWPIFCLVWFGLVKRTRESMTGVPEGADVHGGPAA